MLLFALFILFILHLHPRSSIFNLQSSSSFSSAPFLFFLIFFYVHILLLLLLRQIPWLSVYPNLVFIIITIMFPIESEPYHHHLSKFSFLIQTVSSTSSLLFQFWSLPYPPTHLCCFVFDSAHSPFVFFFFRFCFFAFSWLLNLFPSCSLWQFIHQGSMETESESSPELPILFIGVALVLGLLCRHLLKGTRIPYTGALLVLGIAMGAAGIWHILMNVKEMNSFWCIYLWEET